MLCVHDIQCVYYEHTRTPSRRRRARLARSLASAIWGKEISPRQLVAIRNLVEKFGFSLVSGEIQLLNGNWYVTHAGLLSLAQRRRCEGIQTAVLRQLSDSAIGRWVFRATVYKKRGSEASSATAMLIPPTSLPWSTAPRCASPKLGPSTALSARPTDRPLLCRRTRLVSEPPNPTPHQLVQFEWPLTIETATEWPASPPRPTLPSDPQHKLDPTS